MKHCSPSFLCTHEPWHCPSTQNGLSVPAQDGFSPHLHTFPASSSGCSSCLHSTSTIFWIDLITLLVCQLQKKQGALIIIVYWSINVTSSLPERYYNNK